MNSNQICDEEYAEARDESEFHPSWAQTALVAFIWFVGSLVAAAVIVPPYLALSP
jgi:hypothetical protein